MSVVWSKIEDIWNKYLKPVGEVGLVLFGLKVIIVDFIAPIVITFLNGIGIVV